jgi:hypothetical protein
MKLMMYLGSDLIETVPLNFQLVTLPGYLGGFTRQLKEKHAVLIQNFSEEAEFLVVNLSRSATHKKMDFN